MKSLLDKCDERIENWRNISEWLDMAGYKCYPASDVPLESLLPEQSVINISTINIEQHQLVITFNLKMPTSKAVEFSIPNLDLSDEVLKA